ncbi:MAG TPA: ERCC4 domain-containing protein [bacterium]|nr:ERCC4 domain-containing protein [bacterium]
MAETLSAASPVAQQLSERGVQVTPANLPAGTYAVSGACVIQHLSRAEFTRWIADKTIFRRITELKRAVSEPVLIVEGVENGERTVSTAALRGALAFVAVHNRVPVLFASDPKDSADLIYAMVNQLQNGMGVTLDTVPAAPSVLTVPAQDSAEHDESDNGNGNGNGSGAGASDVSSAAEQIVRMIPEIGPVTARAMLKRFGSLRGVFAANAQDLTKVDGIGPKRAKKIAAFFSRREVR